MRAQLLAGVSALAVVAGCAELRTISDTLDQLEADNCALSPVQRAERRQALIDVLGREKAEALFVTCPPDSAGYHPALDGEPAGPTHPLLEDFAGD